MKSSLRTFVLLGAAVVLMLLVAGCTTTRGGGWIISAAGHGKATFGFQLECQGSLLSCGEVSGQVQYNDHRADVKFHGVADTVTIFCPDGVQPSECEGAFSGRYTPQPKHRGDGGTFYVAAVDAGEPGPSSGDEFCVTLSGGMYDGYENCGVLNGGNVQSFE